MNKKGVRATFLYAHNSFVPRWSMEDPICGVAFPDFKAAFLPSLFPALFPLPLSSVLLFMQNNRMTTTTESFNAATEWRTDCARRSCLSLSNLHLPRGCRFLRGFFLSHVYLVSFWRHTNPCFDVWHSRRHVRPSLSSGFDSAWRAVVAKNQGGAVKT